MTKSKLIINMKNLIKLFIVSILFTIVSCQKQPLKDFNTGKLIRYDSCKYSITFSTTSKDSNEFIGWFTSVKSPKPFMSTPWACGKTVTEYITCADDDTIQTYMNQSKNDTITIKIVNITMNEIYAIQSSTKNTLILNYVIK